MLYGVPCLVLLLVFQPEISADIYHSEALRHQGLTDFCTCLMRHCGEHNVNGGIQFGLYHQFRCRQMGENLCLSTASQTATRNTGKVDFRVLQ